MHEKIRTPKRTNQLINHVHKRAHLRTHTPAMAHTQYDIQHMINKYVNVYLTKFKTMLDKRLIKIYYNFIAIWRSLANFTITNAELYKRVSTNYRVNFTIHNWTKNQKLSKVTHAQRQVPPTPLRLNGDLTPTHWRKTTFVTYQTFFEKFRISYNF